jgi:hypothetical protein
MNDSSTTNHTTDTLTPLPLGAEARAVRRLSMLIGAVPLWEMSQAEVDWVFRAKLRIASDE